MLQGAVAALVREQGGGLSQVLGSGGHRPSGCSSTEQGEHLALIKNELRAN